MKITKYRYRAQLLDEHLNQVLLSSSSIVPHISFCVLRRVSITLLIELLLKVYMLVRYKRFVIYGYIQCVDLWLLYWSGP